MQRRLETTSGETLNRIHHSDASKHSIKPNHQTYIEDTQAVARSPFTTNNQELLIPKSEPRHVKLNEPKEPKIPKGPYSFRWMDDVHLFYGMMLCDDYSGAIRSRSKFIKRAMPYFQIRDISEGSIKSRLNNLNNTKSIYDLQSFALKGKTISYTKVNGKDDCQSQATQFYINLSNAYKHNQHPDNELTPKILFPHTTCDGHCNFELASFVNLSTSPIHTNPANSFHYEELGISLSSCSSSSFSSSSGSQGYQDDSQDTEDAIETLSSLAQTQETLPSKGVLNNHAAPTPAGLCAYAFYGYPCSACLPPDMQCKDTAVPSFAHQAPTQLQGPSLPPQHNYKHNALRPQDLYSPFQPVSYHYTTHNSTNQHAEKRKNQHNKRPGSPLTLSPKGNNMSVEEYQDLLDTLGSRAPTPDNLDKHKKTRLDETPSPFAQAAERITEAAPLLSPGNQLELFTCNSTRNSAIPETWLQLLQYSEEAEGSNKRPTGFSPTFNLHLTVGMAFSPLLPNIAEDEEETAEEDKIAPPADILAHTDNQSSPIQDPNTSTFNTTPRNIWPDPQTNATSQPTSITSRSVATYVPFGHSSCFSPSSSNLDTSSTSTLDGRADREVARLLGNQAFNTRNFHRSEELFITTRPLIRPQATLQEQGASIQFHSTSPPSNAHTQNLPSPTSTVSALTDPFTAPTTLPPPSKPDNPQQETPTSPPVDAACSSVNHNIMRVTNNTSSAQHSAFNSTTTTTNGNTHLRLINHNNNNDSEDENNSIASSHSPGYYMYPESSDSENASDAEESEESNTDSPFPPDNNTYTNTHTPPHTATTQAPVTNRNPKRARSPPFNDPRADSPSLNSQPDINSDANSDHWDSIDSMVTFSAIDHRGFEDASREVPVCPLSITREAFPESYLYNNTSIRYTEYRDNGAHHDGTNLPYCDGSLDQCMYNTNAIERTCPYHMSSREIDRWDRSEALDYYESRNGYPRRKRTLPHGSEMDYRTAPMIPRCEIFQPTLGTFYPCRHPCRYIYPIVEEMDEFLSPRNPVRITELGSSTTPQVNRPPRMPLLNVATNGPTLGNTLSEEHLTLQPLIRSSTNYWLTMYQCLCDLIRREGAYKRPELSSPRELQLLMSNFILHNKHSLYLCISLIHYLPALDEFETYIDDISSEDYNIGAGQGDLLVTQLISHLFHVNIQLFHKNKDNCHIQLILPLTDLDFTDWVTWCVYLGNLDDIHNKIFLCYDYDISHYILILPDMDFYANNINFEGLHTRHNLNLQWDSARPPTITTLQDIACDFVCELHRTLPQDTGLRPVDIIFTNRTADTLHSHGLYAYPPTCENTMSSLLITLTAALQTHLRTISSHHNFDFPEVTCRSLKSAIASFINNNTDFFEDHFTVQNNNLWTRDQWLIYITFLDSEHYFSAYRVDEAILCQTLAELFQITLTIIYNSDNGDSTKTFAPLPLLVGAEQLQFTPNPARYDIFILQAKSDQQLYLPLYSAALLVNAQSPINIIHVTNSQQDAHIFDTQCVAQSNIVNPTTSSSVTTTTTHLLALNTTQCTSRKCKLLGLVIGAITSSNPLWSAMDALLALFNNIKGRHCFDSLHDPYSIHNITTTDDIRTAFRKELASLSSSKLQALEGIFNRKHIHEALYVYPFNTFRADIINDSSNDHMTNASSFMLRLAAHLFNLKLYIINNEDISGLQSDEHLEPLVRVITKQQLASVLPARTHDASDSYNLFMAFDIHSKHYFPLYPTEEFNGGYTELLVTHLNDDKKEPRIFETRFQTTHRILNSKGINLHAHPRSLHSILVAVHFQVSQLHKRNSTELDIFDNQQEHITSQPISHLHDLLMQLVSTSSATTKALSNTYKSYATPRLPTLLAWANSKEFNNRFTEYGDEFTLHLLAHITNTNIYVVKGFIGTHIAEMDVIDVYYSPLSGAANPNNYIYIVHFQDAHNVYNSTSPQPTSYEHYCSPNVKYHHHHFDEEYIRANPPNIHTDQDDKVLYNSDNLRPLKTRKRKPFLPTTLQFKLTPSHNANIHGFAPRGLEAEKQRQAGTPLIPDYIANPDQLDQAAPGLGIKEYAYDYISSHFNNIYTRYNCVKPIKKVYQLQQDIHKPLPSAFDFLDEHMPSLLRKISNPLSDRDAIIAEEDMYWVRPAWLAIAAHQREIISLQRHIEQLLNKLVFTESNTITAVQSITAPISPLLRAFFPITTSKLEFSARQLVRNNNEIVRATLPLARTVIILQEIQQLTSLLRMENLGHERMLQVLFKAYVALTRSTVLQEKTIIAQIAQAYGCIHKAVLNLTTQILNGEEIDSDIRLPPELTLIDQSAPLATQVKQEKDFSKLRTTIAINKQLLSKEQHIWTQLTSQTALKNYTALRRTGRYKLT